MEASSDHRSEVVRRARARALPPPADPLQLGQEYEVEVGGEESSDGEHQEKAIAPHHGLVGEEQEVDEEKRGRWRRSGLCAASGSCRHHLLAAHSHSHWQSSEKSSPLSEGFN